MALTKIITIKQQISKNAFSFIYLKKSFELALNLKFLEVSSNNIQGNVEK
jgi:hypothetical protein